MLEVVMIGGMGTGRAQYHEISCIMSVHWLCFFSHY